jgi:hypothetical protein
MQRQQILDLVLHSDYFPFYIKVDNIDRDYELIYESLYRRGGTKWIGMSRDGDKIWFRRKK